MMNRMCWNLKLWFVLVVLFSDVRMQDDAETDDYNVELSVENYHFYLDFLLAYNQQWPLRRLMLVFRTLLDSKEVIQEGNRDEPREVSRDEVRTALARDETTINFIEQKMVLGLSKNGILCSSIRVPTPKNFRLGDFLYLNDAVQAPVTIVILSINTRTASFMREAAEVGAMDGNKFSWIVFSSDEVQAAQLVNSELGLRPDTQLLAVTLYLSGRAIMERWSGKTLNLTSYNSRSTAFYWDGVFSPLSPNMGPSSLMELTDKSISVAILEDPPYLYVDSTGRRAAGWLYEIWKELELSLNFTSTYYKPQRQTGTLMRRAAEELRLGRADVVLTAAAMEVTDELDFSIPVTSQNFRFYLQRTTTTTSWAQFIQPFTWRVWASVCGLVTLSATLMATTYYIGQYFGLEFPGHHFYDIRESAFVIFGSLIQQGPDYSPEGMGGRIILWCSYAFGLIIYTAYSAALISKLTVRTIDPPFRSLEGMIASSFVPYINPDTAVHRFIMSAERGAWRDLRERGSLRTVLVDTLEQGITTATYTYGATFLSERDRVSPVVQTSPHNCLLAQVPVNILRVPACFLLQKKSPYKAAIDQQLLKMWSNGVLSRWRDRSLPLVVDDPCPAQASLPKFGLKQVTLPFVLLGAGIVISLLLIAIEFTIKNWCFRSTAAPSPAMKRAPRRVRKRARVNEAVKPRHAFID